MKKKVLVLLAVVMVMVLSGCGGSKEIVFGISQAASELLDCGAFTDTLTKCDNDKVVSLYGVDESLLAEYEVYIGTGATAEEIAIFRVKDSKDVETVKASCQSRVDAQKEACENYLPNEMPKLESPVLTTAGNYVILCVSNDNGKVQTVLDGYLKK